MGHVILTTSIRGAVYNSKANTWYILQPVYKNWRLSLQPFWEYDHERRNWK